MPLPLWKRSETWGIGIAILTLLAIYFVVFRDWQALASESRELDQTNNKLRLIGEFFSAVQDMETGQRGFILVGDQAYLAPFDAAQSIVNQKIAELERATAADPAQHARLGRIEDPLARKISIMRRTIDLRRRQGMNAALAVVTTGEGKALMDRIRVEVTQFQNDGRARVVGLLQTQRLYRERVAFVATGGSAILFVLLVFADGLIRRQTNARERALARVAAGKREVEQVRDLLAITLRSIGDAVISTDAQGNITFLNPVAQGLTGWGEEAVGRPLGEVFRVINESNREPVESPVEKVRRTGTVAGLANHSLLIARDGRETPIDDSGAPIRSRNGPIVGFVLVFRDVSQRRAAEMTMRESEDRFRTLANAAPVLLWVTGTDGGVTFVNRQWTEFTGRAVEDDLQWGWIARVHPDDVKRVLDTRRAALPDRLPCSFECRLCRADGIYRSVLCAETPRFLTDDQFAGYVGAWFDITELKEAQRSLEISEERFRVLVAGTTSMVWETSAEGAFDTRMPGWEEFTGQRFEEYGGYGAPEAIHPDDREAVLSSWMASIASGHSFSMEFRLWQAARREYRDVTSRGIPLRAHDGRILRWIGSITDVTGRKRMEERLRQAAKLESLGVLAGGVAHDFNNLLVGIIGNVSLLQSMLTDYDQREIAGEILAAGERAAILTRQMLAYSGRGRFIVEPADLAAEVHQIVPLIRSSIPKFVELVMNLAPGLPAVEVDRAQFQQLVMNLVINAAEAINEPPGTVTVGLYTEKLDHARLEQEFAGEPMLPGTYVVLEVRDTGCGMDAATLAKIFDPFFTTKFTGRGLGLAAVLGIARAHRGAIRVTSAPRAGSTFRVFLPVSSVVVAPQNHPTRAGELVPVTVLVADDEEVVRSMVQNVLTRRGFRVLLAANGREAIDLLEAHRDTVRVVVLDLTMPVVSGEEALPRLREIQPNVRILASSGYNQTEAVRRFGNAIDGFIQKPYSAQDLLWRVGQVSEVSTLPKSK